VVLICLVLGFFKRCGIFKSFRIQWLKDFVKSDVMELKVPGQHSSCNIMPY
jgi:hypothetical protein